MYWYIWYDKVYFDALYLWNVYFLYLQVSDNRRSKSTFDNKVWGLGRDLW